MDYCLRLAQKAKAEGESPVGSIIVKENHIIGTGYEKSRQLNDITRHAEIVAILAALKNTNNLAGSTLYSNVEPCLLCSYAIRHYQIKAVVFLKHCGELGGTRKPYNILTIDHIESWGPPPKITIFNK